MPIARVQMPDGRIARFEVPADMSPQDIEELAQTNIEELQKQQAATAQQKPEAQPEPQSQDVFDLAGNKIREQISSLGNFPVNPQQITQRTFEQARPEIEKNINTAILSSIPSGMLDTAIKRISTAAAGGASQEQNLQDKLIGASKGGLFGIAGETLPIVSAITQASKRRLYDPKFNPERVIGATLKRFAEDPNNPHVLSRTEQALSSPQQFIRGSSPTTAQAGSNAGLWALDKALMSREQAAYRDIADLQNLARVKSLKELGLSEGAKKQGQLFQKEAVQNLNKAKDINANISLAPVENLIDTTLGTGAGKQTQVRSALEKLKGLLRDDKGNLETQLDQIQGIRNEIGVMLSGKLAGEAGNVRFAAGQVGEVKNAIDDAIEQALSSSGNSGLHRAFIDKYKQGAQLINRTEDLNTLLQRSTTTGNVPEIGLISQGIYGPTGTTIPGEILSPAKFNAFIKSKAWKETKQNLTEGQIKRIENIQKDLTRAIPMDIKRGSDTFQNLATDYIMQGIASKGLLESLAKGAVGAAERGINRTPIGSLIGTVIPSANVLENPELRAGLLKAMSDPKNAAKLMKQYRERAPLNFGTIPSRLSGQFSDQY